MKINLKSLYLSLTLIIFFSVFGCNEKMMDSNSNTNNESLEYLIDLLENSKPFETYGIKYNHTYNNIRQGPGLELYYLKIINESIDSSTFILYREIYGKKIECAEQMIDNKTIFLCKYRDPFHFKSYSDAKNNFVMSAYEEYLKKRIMRQNGVVYKESSCFIYNCSEMTSETIIMKFCFDNNHLNYFEYRYRIHGIYGVKIWQIIDLPYEDIDIDEYINSQAISDKTMDVEKAILKYINVERESQGLCHLSLDAKIAIIARNHSLDMVHRNSPRGTLKMENSSNDVDNIGKTQVKSWMENPEYRANILNSQYTLLGVGCAYDGLYYVCTQNFK